MRTGNARQSEAASRSASVFKHELVVYGHGGYIYRANLKGPGGEYRLFDALFCEYTMRGSLPLHPARLGSPSTNEGSTCPVMVLNAGTFGPASRIRRFEGLLRVRNTKRSTAA